MLAVFLRCSWTPQTPHCWFYDIGWSHYNPIERVFHQALLQLLSLAFSLTTFSISQKICEFFFIEFYAIFLTNFWCVFDKSLSLSLSTLPPPPPPDKLIIISSRQQQQQSTDVPPALIRDVGHIFLMSFPRRVNSNNKIWENIFQRTLCNATSGWKRETERERVWERKKDSERRSSLQVRLLLMWGIS